jgi:predicted transposase YdaD
MDRSKSRNLESLRVSMLWKVVESALDEARQFLLVDLIETYFRLSGTQRERYQRLVSRKEYRKVQDVELSWAEELEEKGLKKGLEKGLEKGREDGKRETLLRQLSAKFGRLSVAARTRVEAIDSVDELDALLERILTATSLDDMKL